MDVLKENLRRVSARVSDAAAASGRDAEALTVVAITKYVAPAEALALARLGHSDLGENRHDKLEAKAAAFRAEGVKVRWHFVGHLQRNKARRVAKIAHVIHSVDTPRLIDTLDRAASERGQKIQIFLELRLTEDPGKHGFSPEELDSGLEVLRSCKHLEALGLMCMSSTDHEGDSAAETFARLSDIAAKLEAAPSTSKLFLDGKVRTSMGMSGDFEEAVKAGADYLRIGSAFFDGLQADSQKERTR
jgi:hypothetical protein